MSVSVDIMGSGSAWAVYHQGARLSGFLNQFDKACIAARVWEQRLSATPRRCLCCGRDFTSFGKGHRMCDACREDARQMLG